MEEDRNCNCENDNINMMNMIDNMNMVNMNMMSMNNNMNSCRCNKNEMTRAEMLKKIKCLKFAVVELALYLDTHPDDTKALCLHNKYSKELKEICDKYQKVYGPLTIEYPCNKWRWLEEPWPWEGGND